jgi:hypothetical protein
VYLKNRRKYKIVDQSFFEIYFFGVMHTPEQGCVSALDPDPAFFGNADPDSDPGFKTQKFEKI